MNDGAVMPMINETRLRNYEKMECEERIPVRSPGTPNESSEKKFYETITCECMVILVTTCNW